MSQKVIRKRAKETKKLGNTSTQQGFGEAVEYLGSNLQRKELGGQWILIDLDHQIAYHVIREPWYTAGYTYHFSNGRYGLSANESILSFARLNKCRIRVIVCKCNEKSYEDRYYEIEPDDWLDESIRYNAIRRMNGSKLYDISWSSFSAGVKNPILTKRVLEILGYI